MNARPPITAFLLAATLAAGSAATAAPVILNEYNAVRGDRFLRDSNNVDGRDQTFGFIQGNGGNWFELLVVDDTDLRGWQLAWTEAEETVAGSGINSAGTITLSQNAVWSDVKSGSLLTFIETADAGGSGAPGSTATDASYNPFAGDWTINVATTQEQALGSAGLASTTTNDGVAGEFSVGNNDWTLTVLDASGTVQAAATGEGGAGYKGVGDGVDSREGFALEAYTGAAATVAAYRAVGPGTVKGGGVDGYDDTSGTTFGFLNGDLQADGTFVSQQDVSALRNQLPEPGTAALALAGLGLLAARRRR